MLPGPRISYVSARLDLFGYFARAGKLHVIIVPWGVTHVLTRAAQNGCFTRSWSWRVLQRSGHIPRLSEFHSGICWADSGAPM